MIKLSKGDIMATLTIKVATQGSLYGVNNISRTGHAWISLKVRIIKVILLAFHWKE